MNSKEAEKMAREYASVMSFDVRGHERGFLAGFLAGQQSRWRKYPEDGPEKTAKYVIHAYGTWYQAYWDTDSREFIDGVGGKFSAEDVTDFMEITLPKQEG